jgi:hypothetical protein
MLSLESLLCHVDDFCQRFEPQWQQQLLGDGLQRRQRSCRLCLSEIMTILIAFHQSAYLCLPKTSPPAMAALWHPADHHAQTEHEEPSDSVE